MAAALLVKLAALAVLLPAAAPGDRDVVTWLDVDDTMRRTYGYCTQGVGYGYNKVKGLNALLAIASTSGASCGPVIVGHRLRKGPVSSARGAGKFLADAIAATCRAQVAETTYTAFTSTPRKHQVTGPADRPLGETPQPRHRPPGTR